MTAPVTPHDTLTQKLANEGMRFTRQREVVYEAVRARSKYLESDVMKVDRIPWSYRDIVKRYFQSPCKVNCFKQIRRVLIIQIQKVNLYLNIYQN